MKLNIRLFFMLIISAGFATAQDGWFWQYPKPQGNTLNDIFVFDGSKAIAVGDLGTVIRTTDGGETWDVKHHIAGSSLGLSDVYFLDDRIGWIVRNDAVLNTTDGGESWFEFFKDDTCDLSLVHFVNADTGFVFGRTRGEHYGICFRTTTGGDNWIARRMEGWDYHGFTSACFTSQDTGWVTATGFDGNELYKTVDCGVNWIQQNIQPRVYGLHEVQFVDGNNGFMVGSYGAFLKTTNGGVTWEIQNLSEKYQKQEYQYFYSVHFVDSLHGWILGGDNSGFILRTKDGGANWKQENMEIPGHLYKILFSDTLHGWIVGQFGLIYRTEDRGESWVVQRENQYGFSEIYFINENTGWAVGGSGIIIHTSNGGEYWQKQNIADSILFSSVYAIDTLNVFVVGAVIIGLSIFDQNGIILRTINGGQTWEKQTFDNLYGFNSIVFTNDSTGWISGTNSVLLKTNDRGNTWNIISLDANLPEGKIQFLSENIGWIGGTLKTINGGETWNSQVIPIESLNSFNYVSTKMGWAVASYNGINNILKTTDGGDNWIPSGITPPGYNFSIQFINETTGWISGFDNLNRTSVIIKTTDGGYSWIEQKSPCKNEGGLSDIFFINEKTGWAVGSGIIKTITGGGETYVEENRCSDLSLPQNILLFQNYPNPFNNCTTCRFILKKSYFVTLKVYDICGREMETLVNGYKTPGEYNIKWKADDIPSGLYFYRIKTNRFCETRKCVLIK